MRLHGDVMDSSSQHSLRSTHVRRVHLTDFRSYSQLDLAIEAPIIVLTGENGAGKTNMLEALSLFTGGRGLRRAELASMARQNGAGGWAISIEIDHPFGPLQLGTGFDPHVTPPRKYRLNREPVGSVRAFAESMRVVWLTPSMDGLFMGAAGDRRRFLDRLVLALDADHGSRVSSLERALRNRNRLLEDGQRTGPWIDAAERELAELAIAVAAARAETIGRLAALTQARGYDDVFPWAHVHLQGELEERVLSEPALGLEDHYRALLRDNRSRDAAAGRTLIGPHASDLLVAHGPKNMPAAQCSTGEQKALLVGLFLAHAQLVTQMSGMAPLVLIDEVAAHFDPRRRAALYHALELLGAQIWLTGADPEAFAQITAHAHILHVEQGQIRLQNQA
jgi:DNA replication and repair protein RecF